MFIFRVLMCGTLQFFLIFKPPFASFFHFLQKTKSNLFPKIPAFVVGLSAEIQHLPFPKRSLLSKEAPLRKHLIGRHFWKKKGGKAMGVGRHSSVSLIKDLDTQVEKMLKNRR